MCGRVAESRSLTIIGFLKRIVVFRRLPSSVTAVWAGGLQLGAEASRNRPPGSAGDRRVLKQSRSGPLPGPVDLVPCWAREGESFVLQACPKRPVRGLRGLGAQQRWQWASRFAIHDGCAHAVLPGVPVLGRSRDGGGDLPVGLLATIAYAGH